jgi:hypothetical protein
MPWFRVDDAFPEHRKVLALGDLEPFALTLWLKAGCLSNRSLLGGRVSLRALRSLLDTTGWTLHGQPVSLLNVIGALERVGLWRLDGDAIEFRDYAQYQPLPAAVRASREAAATRKARWKERRERERNAVPNATRTETEREGNGHRTGPPDPDPDPDPHTDQLIPPTPHGGERRESVHPRGGAGRMAAVELVGLWNQHCAWAPFDVTLLTGAAVVRVERALMAQACTLDWWEALFKRAAASPFLTGHNDNGWRADLLWVLEKRLEVASGRYDPRTGPADAAEPSGASAAALFKQRRKA